MATKNSINKALKVLLTTILAVIVFAILAALLKWLLLPRLPKEWQNNTIWFVATAVGTLGILASIAQITGYMWTAMTSDTGEIARNRQI